MEKKSGNKKQTENHETKIENEKELETMCSHDRKTVLLGKKWRTKETGTSNWKQKTNQKMVEKKIHIFNIKYYICALALHGGHVFISTDVDGLQFRRR